MISASSNVLLHVTGVLAISQLIFWTGQPHNAASNLDRGNASSLLHDAVDKLIDNLYSIATFGSCISTLRAVVCIVAAIYTFVLARLEFSTKYCQLAKNTRLAIHFLPGQLIRLVVLATMPEDLIRTSGGGEPELCHRFCSSPHLFM